MSDLDDVLTGIMLAIERSRELVSLWEVDDSTKQMRLLYSSSVLKGDEGFTQLEASSSGELMNIIEGPGWSGYIQPNEVIEGNFGELYIESIQAVQESHYYLVKYDRVPFPFELSHRPRSQKVSDLECKITRNITHELLTPINSIQGLNEQLAETLLDEKTQEVLGLHAESCSLIKTHLSDIVNYVSLSSSESQSYIQENFDLLETLFSISSKANRSILENGRDLSFKLNYPAEKDTLPAKGYPSLLEQTLLHLIDNALKFTPDGGQVSVEFSIENESTLSFSVCDTGCGISESDLCIIFRPFILGDMGDTRTQRGIGLGLSSAQECVIIMTGNENARIAVQSEEGKGSTFSFNLLYEKSTYKKTHSHKGLDLPKEPEQYHVLVAEDNPTQQLIIDRLIKKLGFQSTVVDNGVEALGEYIRADTHYDLILMDIQMPGISGHEATRMIRKHEEEFNWDSIPIVAITANIEKEVHSESLRCGMNGHFGKPVTRVVLDELIRKSLLGISL